METTGKAATTPSTEGKESKASRESSWSTAFTQSLGTSQLRPPGSGTVSRGLSSSSRSSRDFSPASNSAVDSFRAAAAALGVVSEKSSRESRPSRVSSAKEGGPTFGAPAPPPIPSRLSKVSSVKVVVLSPPPENESRELSWLTAELKKAGGSWGVGGGRTEGTVCVEVGVLLGTVNAAWLWAWETWRGKLE